MQERERERERTEECFPVNRAEELCLLTGVLYGRDEREEAYRTNQTLDDETPLKMFVQRLIIPIIARERERRRTAVRSTSSLINLSISVPKKEEERRRATFHPFPLQGTNS